MWLHRTCEKACCAASLTPQRPRNARDERPLHRCVTFTGVKLGAAICAAWLELLTRSVRCQQHTATGTSFSVQALHEPVCSTTDDDGG
jgi:hypothetical protein